DNRPDLGWKVLAERVFVILHRDVLAAGGLRQNCVIILPGDRRFDLDPGAVHCAAGRAAMIGVSTQPAHLVLEFDLSAFDETYPIGEERLRLGVPDVVGTLM